MEFVYTFAGILGTIILGYCYLDYYIFNWSKRDSKNKKNSEISFGQSLDLCNIPVITVENPILGKLNLLIDTGSSSSIINKRIIERHVGNLQPQGTVIGSGGTTNKYGATNLDITCQKQKLDIKFEVVDMSNSFDLIKSEHGVTIHGILGSIDMARYNYVIDFESCSFYIK